LDKETERLVNDVRKELKALRAKLEKVENHALMMAYEELSSTVD
jgi:hypothetical protein